MLAIRSLILTLCFVSSTFARQSPVLLWGAHSEDKPSLTTVSGEEFVKLITPLLADKALIVFLENDLSNKDFLCTNLADGNSCYARLQGVSNKTYYAAVEDPVEVLHKMDIELEYNSVDASGNFSKPLKRNPGKINFLKFDDQNPSIERRSSLQSHDFLMSSITSQFGDDIFFMYVSTPSTSYLKRQRRQASDSLHHYVFQNDNNLLLYYKSLSIIDEKTTTVLEIKEMTVEHGNATAMLVKLISNTGSTLSFDIILSGGYFFMKNVMYNENVFLSSEVYAPTEFSYFCGNLTLHNIKRNEGVPSLTLKWNSLQFQAPFGSIKNTTFVFGDAWHCVGFFSGGILSGLLVVALLLTITFIGVCWMMDINTMDRFDDPKGKTITISASD